ncbi:MAG: hypothetical protein EGP80_08950, partial [Blautia wexlerae]|nr:hypothetical protein [Blautia wexlerae]
VKRDVKLTEPPDAEPHVRWCERSAAKAVSYSINRGVEDHSFDLYIPHCGDSVKECFLRRIPGIIREVIICNRDIDKLWTKC